MASLLAFLVTSAPLAVVVVTASSPTLSSNLRAAYGKAGNTRYRVQISPETNDSPSQYACPSEWDESCQDDPKYRSKLGLSCRFHRTVLPEEKNSCVDWLGAGASWSDGVYDEEDIRNLLKKCPCSCGVKCTAEMDDPTLAPIAPLEFNGKALPNPYVWLVNTDNEENTNDSDNGKREMISREMVWVEIPSEKGGRHWIQFASQPPSTKPAPTDGPTKAPSITPTKSPTALPTDGPTFAPTSAPVAAESSVKNEETAPGSNAYWDLVASLMEGSNPIQVAANHAPPTDGPTKAPSITPTKSPTALPTDGPTKAPSITPTKSPTALPTVEPETYAVFGTPYEVRIYPVSNHLDFWAITQLNAVLNGAANANLELPDIIPRSKSGARIKFSTALLSQDVELGDSYVALDASELYDALIVRVQTTAFVELPHSNNIFPEDIQHVIPSRTAIDEAIHTAYTGGNEEEVAFMLRTSPSAHFKDVSGVEFERFIYPPTPMPSTSPSNPPSYSPTNLPTVPPSFAPSDKPSNQPTNVPTFRPSSYPSFSPTTHSPSMKPSVSPTVTPTAIPSFLPSTSPTLYPSESPTAIPSFLPTDRPTKSPSTTPTKSPTALPTDGPTFAPTSAATRAGFWHTVASLIHDPTAAPVAVNQVPPTAAPTSDGVPLIVASVVQSPQAQDTQHSAPQLLNTPLWMFAAFVAGGMALLVFTIALLSYVRGKRTMHTTNVDSMHKSKAIRQLAESAQDDSIETSPCDHTSEASDAHSKSTASTSNKRRLISSSASNGMSVIVEDDKWTGDGQKTKPETKLEIVKEEKDESIVDWLKARAMEQLEAGHYI